MDFSSFTPTLFAQLTVAKIFSDNAVLQRDIALKCWGTATPNATVNVNLNDIISTVRANKSGKWIAKIPKQKAGGPYSIIISTDSEEIVLKNILIGDVWLCSGQSNMEWQVSNSNNAEVEIEAATDSNIRHFKVPLTSSYLPQDTLAGGTWNVCSPETAGNFTAVGYYFAKELRNHQDVPIGLLNSSWGGSRIEPWMRAEVLGYENAEESSRLIQAYIDSIKLQTKIRFEKLLGDLPQGEDRGMKGNIAFWASPDYNHTSWKTMEVPGLWEAKGYEGVDGVLWFRKEIYLTKEETKKDIQLSLGAIDDNDITYINGKEIGKTNAYNVERNYLVPALHLKPGVNILTIRVDDTGGGGGYL